MQSLNEILDQFGADSEHTYERLANELAKIVSPYNIDTNKCDIFEETLLKMAGVTEQPSSCGLGKSQKTPMFFFFDLGLSYSAGFKFIRGINQKYGFGTLERSPDFNQGNTFAIKAYLTTFIEKVLPDFKNYLAENLSVSERKKYLKQCGVPFNDHAKVAESILNLAEQINTKPVAGKYMVSKLQELSETLNDKEANDRNIKHAIFELKKSIAFYESETISEAELAEFKSGFKKELKSLLKDADLWHNKEINRSTLFTVAGPVDKPTFMKAAALALGVDEQTISNSVILENAIIRLAAADMPELEQYDGTGKAGYGFKDGKLAVSVGQGPVGFQTMKVANFYQSRFPGINALYRQGNGDNLITLDAKILIEKVFPVIKGLNSLPSKVENYEPAKGRNMRC